MGGWVCLCLVLLASYLQVVSAGSSLMKCNLGTKLCKDGSECIPYSHVCDGERDCKDGSDEEDCESGCGDDQFQCAHGKKCIDKDQVCDGVLQCQDLSDEQHCMKQMENCDHHCDNKNRCLRVSFICDGERDCLDGTDEASCEDQDANTGSVSAAKQSHHLKCPLGTKPCKDHSDCIYFNHVCDGEADCKDGSDEEDCLSECESYQFQCRHGKKCIEKKQVCDGVPQCQDRSDELDCVKRVEGCVHQCDENSRCVPKSFICDGEKDCVDGSDEATCDAKTCSSTDFRCTSGQCVSASVRCDGHPDCWDRSDEEGCTKEPVCTTKHRCPQSKECLVQEWICDGDQDCNDGSDEKDCPVVPLSCGDFQWRCKSKSKCVPAVWRCDGMKDCDDGSDEDECGMATCLPHEFQCGSQECLSVALVCNGITNCADGSDEGGSCQTECAEADDSRCSQGCYSTPQGPRCHCAAGYKLQEDGWTCVDINECEGQTPGVCSHLCSNTVGSYKCDCHPGFTVEAGGHQCKISGEPSLLTSIQTELYLYSLRHGTLDVLSSSAKKAVLSLDYDLRDKKVFWVSVDTETIRWSSMDQKTTGILIKGVRADSVAVDWLGRNLYWIDGVKSQIVAVKLAKTSVKSLDRSIILDEDLDQPRSLALLPQKGLMFWTEIGNEVKIERAGMDGSERRAVVNSSLGWPGGIAVDFISERVYWTDERLKAIGSSTLDGGDVKILQLKETTNPFSVAVFNDMVYWSDAKKRVVQAASKLSGKNCHILLKRPGQPFAVKIVHEILQMDTDSPCKKMDCSHMCVLAPRRRAVCMCPSDLMLAEDGLTCSSHVSPTILLLLSPSTVTKIILQFQQAAAELKGWPEHMSLKIPNVNKATIMDYSLQENTLVLTDATTSLNSFKLKDSVLVSQGQLLTLLDDKITAMALDWVTLNVYWSSNKQPRLQVTSKTGAYTAVVIKDGISGIGCIALHPPSGTVCFTNLDLQDTGSKGAIECAHMDGAQHRVVWKDAVQPTSLVFSKDGDTIYWVEMGTGTINSVHVNGSQYKKLETVDGLTAIALGDDSLIWMTTNDMTRLWYKRDQQQKLWFEVGAQVVGLKSFKSSRSGSSQCAKNNGNCQHLCLTTPAGRTCKCAHDHMVVKHTKCIPQESCSPGSRQCLNQTCLPVTKFCDGHADCSDHSDENCVGLKRSSGPKVSPPIHPRGSSPRPFLPEMDQDNLSDDELTNLEAQQCNQNHCSSNGRCVLTEGIASCVCSEGYSGATCEDKVAKGMQGPIIYGAAGLCAGIVFIAVIAIVIKKKSASRSSNSETAKEMSMSDLKNKAETNPCTQTAQADVEKPEEPPSSGN